MSCSLPSSGGGVLSAMMEPAVWNLPTFAETKPSVRLALSASRGLNGAVIALCGCRIEVRGVSDWVSKWGMEEVDGLFWQLTIQIIFVVVVAVRHLSSLQKETKPSLSSSSVSTVSVTSSFRYTLTTVQGRLCIMRHATKLKPSWTDVSTLVGKLFFLILLCHGKYYISIYRLYKNY